MRFAALWFPDWPVQALGKPGALVAIERAGEIRVCSHAARGFEVRRGMRVRQAQALCPQLQVVSEDISRDAQVFEQVVYSLDAVVAGIEVMRPGLVVVDILGAARYYGAEDSLIELLIDAAAMCGVDCFVGVADEITTAVIASRVSAIVPIQYSEEFLSQQPVSVLLAEEALGVDIATVQVLQNLGIRTLGDIARLGARDIAARFGTHGMHIFQIAVADTQRCIAPKLEEVTFRTTYIPDDPIVRVDTAAFVGRQLASELHMKLQHYGVVCQRLCIQAEFANGDILERTWRTRKALSESGMADRVRWQLDGWLTNRAFSTAAEEGGIVALTLDPVEVSLPEHRALWGDDYTDEHVQRVIERVQSTLGSDKVLQPYYAGGLGLAHCVKFVSYGEPTAEHPVWNGALLSPHPGRLVTGIAYLFDEAGNAIYLDKEFLLSAPPASLRFAAINLHITAWAGPWLAGSRARMQVVADSYAYVLRWEQDGQWHLEASYT